MTFWNFVVMVGAVFGVPLFLPAQSFSGFLVSFLVLFTCTGIGNASTFRMIPIIFRKHHERDSAGMDEEGKAEATRIGLEEGGAVLGFSSAIAAYGEFIIPKSYGTSTELFGGLAPALGLFIVFYVVCLSIC